MTKDEILDIIKNAMLNYGNPISVSNIQDTDVIESFNFSDDELQSLGIDIECELSLFVDLDLWLYTNTDKTISDFANYILDQLCA
jgi:hypothetical protein